eukprot:9717-Heterococcus_DN1.PRE.1
MQGKHTLIFAPLTVPAARNNALTTPASHCQLLHEQDMCVLQLQKADCMLLCTAVLALSPHRALQTYVTSNATQGRAGTLNSINFLRMLHSVEFLSIVNATDNSIMLSVNSKLTAGA